MFEAKYFEEEKYEKIETENSSSIILQILLGCKFLQIIIILLQRASEESVTVGIKYLGTV